MSRHAAASARPYRRLLHAVGILALVVCFATPDGIGGMKISTFHGALQVFSSLGQ